MIYLSVVQERGFESICRVRARAGPESTRARARHVRTAGDRAELGRGARLRRRIDADGLE
jgi:hypothetical protein